MSKPTEQQREQLIVRAAATSERLSRSLALAPHSTYNHTPAP